MLKSQIIENPGEWSENVEVLMNAIITAKVDALTIWNVHVDGQLYDPYDNLMEVNDLTLCCYFNLGIDAEIGTSNFKTSVLYKYRFRKTKN